MADLPTQGAIATSCVLLGGLIGQVITNRQKIHELKVSTEEKHLAITLDEATLIRKELRNSVERLEKELASWQAKYYLDIIKLKEENFKLSHDLEALRIIIQDIRNRDGSEEISP